MLKLAATLWKKDAIEKKFNILIQFLFLLSHRALTIYTNTFSTRGALYILGSASIRVWLLLESGFYSWNTVCGEKWWKNPDLPVVADQQKYDMFFNAQA